MKDRYDNIEDVYEAPNSPIKQGSRIRIEVVCSEPIDEISGEIVRDLLRLWTFPYNRKYIKPFKLEKYDLSEFSFEAILKILKKEEEIDELKLFCEDLLKFFNYDHIYISKWTVDVIS
ncbi:hypothetical protein [Paenibacillus eucommiae]|uniref:Uncharacterized protein n=1 Tax=Paenibacillus eucommiae TaxID=1355755 RepID=A0ABS4IM34_9BACL|nr:hypothetical protein [Paenibacillus eucommiae]MBP1988622.1 hypothetical protein [Paenibacillus eucommiae]